MISQPFNRFKKRDKPRRKRPELTRRPKQNAGFLDSRSYVTKGGRVRLFGQDYRELKLAAWMRARAANNYEFHAHCECGCGKEAHFCSAEGCPDSGELSHNEHGARKSDELARVKWMRHECHMRSHNAGGKPCPKKVSEPGQVSGGL